MAKKTPKLDESGNPVKPKRKHSPETIAKMSERRRARTVQPRSGTSKKRQNLYQELKHEYKDNKEVLKWLETNKSKLNDTAQETRDMGIQCEFHLQYSGIYEIKVGSVLYGDKVEETFEKSNDPYEDELVDTGGLDEEN